MQRYVSSASRSGSPARVAVIILLLSLALVTALASCGSGSDEADEDARTGSIDNGALDAGLSLGHEPIVDGVDPSPSRETVDLVGDVVDVENFEGLVNVAHLVVFGDLKIHRDPEWSRPEGDNPIGQRENAWVSLEVTEGPLHINPYALANRNAIPPVAGDVISVGLSKDDYLALAQEEPEVEAVSVAFFGQHFSSDTKSGFGPTGGLQKGVFVLDEEREMIVDRQLSPAWAAGTVSPSLLRHEIASISQQIVEHQNRANRRLELLQTPIGEFKRSDQESRIKVLNSPVMRGFSTIVQLDGANDTVEAFGIVCATVSADDGSGIASESCDISTATLLSAIGNRQRVGVFDPPKSLHLSTGVRDCTTDLCRLVVVTSDKVVHGSVPLEPPRADRNGPAIQPQFLTEIPEQAVELDVSIEDGSGGGPSVLIRLNDRPAWGRYWVVRCKAGTRDPRDCSFVATLRPTGSEAMHALADTACVGESCVLAVVDLQDYSRRSVIRF